MGESFLYIKCDRGDKIMKSKNKVPALSGKMIIFEIIKQITYQYLEYQLNQSTTLSLPLCKGVLDQEWRKWK